MCCRVSVVACSTTWSVVLSLLSPPQPAANRAAAETSMVGTSQRVFMSLPRSRWIGQHRTAPHGRSAGGSSVAQWGTSTAVKAKLSAGPGQLGLCGRPWGSPSGLWMCQAESGVRPSPGSLDALLALRALREFLLAPLDRRPQVERRSYAGYAGRLAHAELIGADVAG